MDGPPKYSKGLRGEDLRYVGSDEALRGDAPFEVQISVDDAGLEDAFRAELPARMSRLNLGDLLNDLLSEDEAEQDDVLASMDLNANPDLPEIYEELLDIFDQWRAGNCTLRFYANNGPEVQLFQPVGQHLSTSRPDALAEVKPLLDLVVERRYEVLASFEESGGDAGALLEWLRGLLLLYFIDKHGFELTDKLEDSAGGQLLEIASGLSAKGLLSHTVDDLQYEITTEGRQFLGRTISETEGYIDRYGLFDDVVYDMDAGTVEFGTGSGEDLRVPVYRSEGVDPVRAVFLLRLYDSTLDAYAYTWQDRVSDTEFFDEVLSPVLDHRQIDDEVIEWIVETGLAHQEEAAEAASKQASQRETFERVRGQEPQP